MAISNITSIARAYPQLHGAVIRSVATLKEHKVHYGVQSATFAQTVFPGQATGTYRIKNAIPTWVGAKITAKPSTASSYRAAGSTPVPYPPHNASAYYSTAHTRIIPNTEYKAYG